MDNPDRSALALGIVDALEDGLAVYDEQFRFVLVNPAAERLLGMTESLLVGRSQWEMFPATVGTAVEEAFRSVMAGGGSRKFEHFLEAGGVWCEVVASPSANGELIARFHDITDQKRAVDNLRARALFPEQNPNPVLRVGRDGTILLANPSAARMLEDWNCGLGGEAPEVFVRAVACALAEDAIQGIEIESRGRIIAFAVSPLRSANCANFYGHDVTPLKNAEESLRQLNHELDQRVAEQTLEIRRAYELANQEGERLHHVLDMLPAYTVLLSKDYHVPFANRFFRERFGESRGLRCYEYLFNRTEPCEVCESFMPFTTQAPHRWEWLGPDGRNYDIYDFPFQDRDGSTHVLEVGLDITERKRAEALLLEHRDNLAKLVAERTSQLEAANLELQAEIRERAQAEEDLRQNREWLRVTLTSIGDAVIASDIEGRIAFLNPVASSLTGWRPEEALGRPVESVFQVMDEQSCRPIENLVARVIEERRPIRLANNSVLVTRDGGMVPIEDSAAPILGGSGEPVGAVLVFHDVTARRRSQQMLAAAHADALREKLRLEAVMESLPVGVALVDEKGGTTNSNSAFDQIWGTPQPLARSIADYTAFQAYWTDSGKLVQPEEWASARAVQKGQTVIGQEFEIQRFDGTRAFVLNSAAPIRDAKGRIAGSAVAIMDITGLKRAEAAVRDSEAQLQAVVQHLDEGVTVSDLNGRFLHWNRAAIEMHGFTNLEECLRRLEEFTCLFELTTMQGMVVPPDQWPLSRVLRGEDLRDCELQVRRLDNERRWIFSYGGSLVRDAAGQPLLALVTLKDITEKRQAEDRIRHDNVVRSGINRILSEALGERDDRDLGRICLSIAEEMTRSKFGFIGELDADGLLNDIAVSDPGWEACRVQAPSGQRRLPLKFPIHGLYGRVILDGKGFYTNDPASHPDSIGTPQGHPALTAFLGVPLLQEGRTIGMIAVANREGGYRPQDLEAAEALAAAVVQAFMRNRAERALRRSRADLNHAQAVAQVGSWRYDIQRNVVTCSDETHRLFAFPRNVVLTIEDFLGKVHPDDRELVERRWNAALEGEPYEVEHKIMVDGAVRWVRERAELELDPQGVPLGGIGTVQDITERKLVEEERAKQARLKDEFLSLLGHELRNPLAVISTAMHLITGGVTAERRRSLDEMMSRQVTVLKRLVDDLLDLARITHGQIELREDRVELSHVLQEAVSAARSQMAHRGQELVLRMPAGHVQFMADSVRLGQVIANLLDNASKYTGSGGRIELSGAREENEVVIRCKDNGRGIPPGDLKTIFEPFTRVRMAGEGAEAGVGIGLALVKRLAELHGGTVLAESGGPGMGSEFVVRLPLVEPRPSPPESMEERSEVRSIRALPVVVVEDNRDVAESLMISLERAGHKVTLFADGFSALKGLTRLRPAAVVFDIGLPGIDGYELAARLRKRPSLRSAMFIAISGFKRRMQDGKACGDFDHYFVKPVDPDKLLALLDEHAEQREKSTAKARAPRQRNPVRALLVEDNAELAALTADLLVGEGLEVRTALSGKEALEVASSFRPRLILCDLHLPDMSGQEVVRALRSKPATRRAFAVILTALPESDLRALRRRAKDAGIDQFISKPLTSDGVRALRLKLKPEPAKRRPPKLRPRS